MDRAPRPNDSAAAVVKRGNLRGQTKGDVRDLLWTNRARATAAGLDVAEPRLTADEDIGEIAVVEDDGTIFLTSNAFDLANAGLRFRPTGEGYEVLRADVAFRSALGARLSLADDDTAPVALAAPLNYFGRSVSQVFVNSDGNLTFGSGDGSSSTRSVGRFLGGLPRLAAFFADLDPSVSGRVFAAADASGLTVTWCAVPGFDNPGTVTVQATLQTSGTIELRFGEVSLREAVVGVSPGSTETYAPVDLGAAGPTPGGAGAIGERFGSSGEADLVSAARRFYRTHGDIYDQLVFWGQSGLIPIGRAFAQEFTVGNAIRGIGVPLSAYAPEFGSGGRLQSVVNMDRIFKYPENPTQRFLGEDTVLSLLGQEAGHRWLAFVNVLDADRQRSTALLGRDDAHWSFFLDSDASVMEGNDIEALGGGAFRTVGAVSRFSRLDQYIMGLVPPEQVPPFFYVESPTNVVPGRDRESSPETGVTFNGTRRDVLVADIVAAMGERQPPAATAPKVWRQAWIFLVRRGSPAAADEIARIERWRAAWEPFFLQATEGRMRLDAKLR